MYRCGQFRNEPERVAHRLDCAEAETFGRDEHTTFNHDDFFLFGGCAMQQQFEHVLPAQETYMFID